MITTYPDVSGWQGRLRMDGAAAIVAKATQGTSYVDPAYPWYRAEAFRLGVLFGAYHWLDTTDAASQARHAFDVVGPDVALMIDDEQGVIDVPHTLTFVRAYRALGGLVTLEYAPRWVWSASGQPDLRPLAAAGLALVASWYGAGVDAAPAWAPYGGVTPAILQYTDAQPFAGTAIDYNAFRGTLTQLAAIFYPAKGANMPLRYKFVNLPDTPDGLNARVHIGDGLHYRVQGISWQVDQAGDTAGAGPIRTITPADLPAGWDYAHAVSQLLGAPDTAAPVDSAALMAAITKVQESVDRLHAAELAGAQAQVAAG